MKVEVEVKAEDIKAGQRASCHACPVALALARATGVEVEVNYSVAFWSLDDTPYYYKAYLPSTVVDFITLFDRVRRGSHEVQPFTFSLEGVREKWED